MSSHFSILWSFRNGSKLVKAKRGDRCIVSVMDTSKLQVQVHLFPHRHQAKCSGRAKSGRIERWTVMDNTWNSKMILQVWRAAAATHQPSTQIREKAVAFYFLMILQTPWSCPAKDFKSTPTSSRHLPFFFNASYKLLSLFLKIYSTS